MPVLIHSARRGQNPAVIFPSALLVEGSAPKPLWTQNFILRLRVLRTLSKGTPKRRSLSDALEQIVPPLLPDGCRKTQ